MDNPQPTRRRWFQFGLRGLLIAVTVSGFVLGFLAYAASWARQRDHFLSTAETTWAGSNFPTKRPPWPLRVLTLGGILRIRGCFVVEELYFFDEEPQATLDRARLLFPEAALRTPSNPNWDQP